MRIFAALLTRRSRRKNRMKNLTREEPQKSVFEHIQHNAIKRVECGIWNFVYDEKKI